MPVSPDNAFHFPRSGGRVQPSVNPGIAPRNEYNQVQQRTLVVKAAVVRLDKYVSICSEHDYP